MKKINFSITIVTAGLVLFAILCSPQFTFPLLFLLSFLLVLQVGLVWMVITILKNGTPPSETFDQRFYEDADLGPRA